MTPFQERIHEVSGALAQLQVEILERLAACSPGGPDAHSMDSILEATTALRDAFDQFVRTTMVTSAPSTVWARERA